MPELILCSSKAKSFRMDPDVFGPDVPGRRGAESFLWQQAGVVLSRRDRATRKVYLKGRVGQRRLMTVDGVGRVVTPEKYRRKGYAAALLAASIEQSSADGYQLAMLFSDDPLVDWYRRQGWTMRRDLSVTCRDRQNVMRPVSMDRLWVGLRTLTARTINLSTITGIEIEGGAW